MYNGILRSPLLCEFVRDRHIYTWTRTNSEAGWPSPDRVIIATASHSGWTPMPSVHLL